MSCSCCNDNDDRRDDTCACGQDSCRGDNCSVNDANPAAGARARFEVKLLAARFVVASLLFALGLTLGFIAGPQSVWSAPIVARSFFVLSWLVAGYRVVFYALRNITRGQVFDENFLMTVATVGAFLIGQWTEGAAVMLFYNLGEMVQESAVHRSRRSISALMDVRPDFARLLADNAEVHPSSVPLDSLILVKPGEKVPLDGIITEGTSTFDTSRLTGESLPREAFPGETALAGFVNGGGLLTIRTTAVYAETAAARMLSLIENAQSRKAKAEKLITSFARVYTPIVTIGALLLAVLPPLILSLTGATPLTGWVSFQPWVGRALVFLVISCPCAFVISVPLGFFGGIGGAAKLGILVKGADYIDVLAKAKAVVFDKTGTLTQGVFRVRSVEVAGGGDYTDRYVHQVGTTEQYTDRYVQKPDTNNFYTDRYVYELAAAAEWHSNHPAGLAIREQAAALEVPVRAELITDYTEKAGYGVCLKYDGRDVIAGSRRLLEESGVTGLPPVSVASGTAVEIAENGRFAGRIMLGDEVKKDSAAAVSGLRSLGVRDIVMLTGDTASAAREIADGLGITEVRSGVLPHQKVSYFEEISARVKADHPKASVLFVGDGINDAPVLALADAGIAMGAIGSDAAIEAADVVLMNDSPSLVATAIRSARWTRRIVAQNIALSFIIKIGFLALGAFGIATLWEAVFADVGVALLATLNSLRARSLPANR